MIPHLILKCDSCQQGDEALMMAVARLFLTDPPIGSVEILLPHSVKASCRGLEDGVEMKAKISYKDLETERTPIDLPVRCSLGNKEFVFMVTLSNH